MSNNTFGRCFSITTAGESHGLGLVCIVDGCPAGIKLDQADFKMDMQRRKPGQSHYTTQRKELDEVNILSGVFEGETTGQPIGLLIKNIDAKSKDYDNIKSIFRPGHADFTVFEKYGIRDYRGGGRASARETALWVAAGVIAKKVLLKYFNIQINAFLTQMGEIKLPLDFNKLNNLNLNKYNNQNPFFIANYYLDKIESLEKLILKTRKSGDSIGAKVSLIAQNIPAGWGEPVFNKLDAALASALMGIPAAKAVEIGDGCDVVNQKGSEHRDVLNKDERNKSYFETNHCGGILGGISNGMPIVAHVSFKPTSSIVQPVRTLDTDYNKAVVSVKGRHDPCVGIRAVPVVEAISACVLLDFALLHRARDFKNF